MAKVSYAKLALKINTETKSFDFNGNKIEVLQYLPVEDKYSLVNITMQEAKENGVFNPVKLDMYFHLNLVYLYTNLTFTEKQREDEAKLYDTLMSNGFITQMIGMIPENEYNDLMHHIETAMEDILKYKNTFNGTIKDLIDSLPLQAGEIQKIMDSFDPQKFQNVLDFAKAANGGNPIN